jgi:serine/threonine-protein kinase
VSLDTIGGRYRVERKLGDGAMSTVVLAQDGELGRRVAVKLLDETLATDESFRTRFAREARAAASLSHENVVGVFDVGEAEGRPYIVMEHVAGRTLDDRLREEGALPPADVCRIGRQVCAGLAHAHAAGLIHRDLKPGNLIEHSDGRIKIADFGIARLTEATELTEAGTIVGTAAYLSPEQAEGGAVTEASDVFALGVVLYELLTARRPWEVESLAGLAARRTSPPAELPAHTPWALRQAIERSLSPEPADRPTVTELADLLEAPEDEATLVIPRRSSRGAERRSRHMPDAAWLVLLGLAALILGLGAAAIALGDDDGADNAGGATTAPAAQLEDGASPSEDARNLAEWLRANGG